jgi:pimeloyl-ACP methyl ester carboxylesterase
MRMASSRCRARSSKMSPAPHTILVHGFLRSRFDMFLLAPRLQKLIPSTSVHCFGYPSRKLTMHEAALRLADFISSTTKGEAVSFVGHSLGGLIVRALDSLPQAPAPLHRLVTLGTPHQGATIARFLAQSPLMRTIGGPVLAELAAPPLPLQPRRLRVGCIIGHTATRFGFLPLLGRDNDGLVCVDEAVFSACVEEERTHTFHGYFPFSKRSAHLAAHFLIHGTFSPPNGP